MMAQDKRERPDHAILSEFSSEAYKKAIHDSWNSLMYIFGETPQYEFNETKHVTTLACPVKISLFNRVLHTRLTASNADETIQETIDYFSSKGLPFTWHVDPGDTPPDLPERLEKNGLTLSGGPGMALVLSEFKAPEPREGFSCERVRTQEMLKTFSRLLPEAYGIPVFAWEDFAQIIMSVGIRDDFCHYLGFLDGHPVTTSSVLYADGVAGIYDVATLPEARGRRMGSMITAMPLIDARKIGYKISILHSTAMGYNLYRRLGYEEICRMVRFVWNSQS